MQPHASSVTYVQTVLQRPGMFIGEYDIRALEEQLQGFDAALHSVGVLGHFQPFNQVLRVIVENAGLSTSTGWAKALQQHHGIGEPSFNALLSLLAKHFPAEFATLRSADSSAGER